MLGFKRKRTNLHEKYDYPSEEGSELKPMAIKWALRVVAVMCVVLAWSETVQQFLGLTPGAAMAIAVSVIFGSWLLMGGLNVGLRAMRHPVDEIKRGLDDRSDGGRDDSPSNR